MSTSSSFWLKQAQAQGWLPTDWGQGADTEPSPMLTALVFLGALLCSIPLLGFLGLGLGEVLVRSAAGYVVGALGMVAAVWWLRRARHIFANCMALELWGLGFALMLVRWLDDANGGPEAMLAAALFLSVALVVSARMTNALWVVRLMGVALAAALGVALLLGLNVAGAPDHLLWMWTSMGLPVLALIWAWWCWNEPRRLGQAGAARGAAMADGFAVGLLLSELTLSAGWYLPMQLLGWQSEGDELARGWLMAFPRWLAVGLVIASGWALMHRWSAGVAVRAGWQTLVGLIGLMLAIAAWFSPGVGTVAVMSAVAAASARWRLLMACGLAALVLLSHFYYNVTWSLVDKGLGLMVMGASVAIALAVLARRARHASVSAPLMNHSRRSIYGVLLGGVMALGLVNVDVWRKEAVIAEGQRILVPLVPVDPRSLMQGDYMQLRFAIPQPMLDALHDSAAYSLAKKADAVARLNESGEAELLRLAKPSEPLAEREILLPLQQLKGQWVLVTDAYFFPEGEGARFEKARFGEFRALPNGRALLVGLADAEGRGIPAHANDSLNSFPPIPN